MSASSSSPTLTASPNPLPPHELWRLIEDACLEGYRFSDHEYGIPYIEEKDLECLGDGLSVLRFRFPAGDYFKSCLRDVVSDVCARLGVAVHLEIADRVEYGLPYCEAAWVIQQ